MSIDVEANIRQLPQGMSIFHIAARIETSHKGYEGCRHLPTFYVVGANTSDAAHNALTIIGLQPGHKLPDGARVSAVKVDATHGIHGAPLTSTTATRKG